MLYIAPTLHCQTPSLSSFSRGSQRTRLCVRPLARRSVCAPPASTQGRSHTNNLTNTASIADNGFSYNQPGFLRSPTRLLRDAREYKLSSSNRFSFSACFWEYRSWVAQCVVPWFKLSMKWSLSISGWDAYPEFCEFQSERDVSVSLTM